MATKLGQTTPKSCGIGPKFEPWVDENPSWKGTNFYTTVSWHSSWAKTPQPKENPFGGFWIRDIWHESPLDHLISSRQPHLITAAAVSHSPVVAASRQAPIDGEVLSASDIFRLSEFLLDFRSGQIRDFHWGLPVRPLRFPQFFLADNGHPDMVWLAPSQWTMWAPTDPVAWDPAWDNWVPWLRKEVQGVTFFARDHRGWQQQR